MLPLVAVVVVIVAVGVRRLVGGWPGVGWGGGVVVVDVVVVVKRWPGKTGELSVVRVVFLE